MSWFEIRVRSFPTPAAFVWPDSFQAQLASVTDDVTHYRVSIDTADYTELATFDVTGRNGENGPLFSTIQIRVELERESMPVFVKWEPQQCGICKSQCKI